MRYTTFIKKSFILLMAALCVASCFGCDLSALDIPQSLGPMIVFNEVVTSNGESYVDEVYGSPDWIELKNIGNTPVSLLGYRVTDNIQNTDKACLLPDITLAAGECLLLFANKEQKTDTLSYESGPIFLGFSLKLSGENLALEDSNMQLIQELTVPALERDISYARRDNGSYGFCAEPTPGSENTTEIYNALSDVPHLIEEVVEPIYTPQAGIVFSEVSARNNETILCTGCEGCDWVELYNETNADISLDNFALTDDPDDYDKPNLFGVVLPANGYLVIRCCQNECETTDGHVCVRMGVSRYGDHLYLFDMHGMQCAEIEFGETLKKDMTFARTENGAYVFTVTPTPGEGNVITEYIEEPEPTEEPEPIFVGTNSPVIINEALPSNGYSIADREGDRCDWVELYNPGTIALNLSGWFLSDGKDYRKWAFPDVSIEAKGYLLVFCSGKENIDGELHANFSLAEGESIKLYNSADNTYDLLHIPVSKQNVSIGRDEAGEIVYYGEPTPLSPNGHPRKEADSFGFFQSDSVYISEVCAIHARGSNENDWIELHNGSGEAVSLDGCFLTDDIDEPTKYRISGLSMDAGAYTVLTVNKYQGSFSISPSGETIYLIRPDGRTVMDCFDTGVQRVGMSSGRLENDPSVRRVFFEVPSKGKANGGSYETGYTSEPIFSQTALYCTEAFQLTLSDLQADATIYYTTDGTEPTQKSSRYTEPITIKKNTVIRAYAVSDGLMDSGIITYTYLFEQPHTVPVVCLSMPASDFKAVYNVNLHANIKERKTYVSIYESDGLIATCFPCDVKAKGQGTLKYMSQKSLTLTLRAEYGQSSVKYPFYENYPYTEFSALTLRNGGQDYTKARMRDSFVSRACIGLNVEVANSRPVVVYVNGEYYGLYDLNEELNSRYVETHYGVDADTVNVIMRNGVIARKGTTTDWKKDFANAKKVKLTTQEAYDEFVKKVDPDYFMDYVIVRTFIRDGDMFNQKYWRTEDYGIRWRPILYDLDMSLDSKSRNGNMMHNYFDYSGTPSNNGSLTYFYMSCALKTNPDWCDRFVERYVEVVMTHLNPERMNTLLNQMIAEYEPEMARHIARWKHPSSVSVWKQECETLRKVFEHRYEIIFDQVKKEFKVSDARMNELIAKYSNP